jgi:hypothetical protein
MQQQKNCLFYATRDKYTSITIQELLGNCVFCWGRPEDVKPAKIEIFIKLYRRHAEVIQKHVNEHVRRIGQGEARHREYKRLKLGGGQAYDTSSD